MSVWLKPVYFYAVDIKQQLKKLNHFGSKRANKFHSHKPAEKILASSVFLYSRDVILIDYLHKGKPIIGE